MRAALLDDPVQGALAKRTLEEADVIAVTLHALCEFVWVLSRGYKVSLPTISDAIRTLIAAGNVEVDRQAVRAGLSFMDAGGDFADGIIAYEGSRLGGEVFLSFDSNAVFTAKKCGIASELLKALPAA